MKLLLNGGGSTQQLKMTINKLNEIINHKKTILYVPLAMDEVEHPYDSCYEWFKKQLVGIDAVVVNMPRTFEEFASLNFDDYSAIFIGGGNTYKLLKGIKENGIYNKILSYLNNDGIIVGCSAGSIIFGFDIDSCLVMDSNDVDLKDTKGFNVLNGKSVFAHYTNSKTEEIHKKYTNYLIQYSIDKESVIALPEEDTIFIDDRDISFIGDKPYYIFNDGKIEKYYITPVIETERLILKRAPLSDYLKVYEYDFTKLRNINDEFEFVKLDSKRVEGFEEIYEKSFDWIVYLKDGMKPISNIVADREREDINSIELAFNTHPIYWRRGYTSEAIIGIMRFLFNNGYDNIICGYDEGNFKSKSIGEKLGFIPYEVKENSWVKDGVPITSYITILSKERFADLYN